MDEFRRMQMKMGMSTSVKPRSSFPWETYHKRSGSQLVDPEDFSDVFGGPPRNELRRHISCSSEFFRPSTSSFYEDIFQIPEAVAPIRWSGVRISRNLPEFRIPPSKGGDERRSSDDMNPLRPAIPNDDVAFSVLTSKLRPVHVPPPRRNSAASIPEQQYSYFNRHFTRKVPSPETISLDPNSYGSFKVSMDDLELNSPSSSSSSCVASLWQEIDQAETESMNDPLQEEVDEDSEDEVMSSYVIEINSDHRERTEEEFAIDEAIAWAKEKFQSVSRKEEDEKSQSPNPKGSPITNGLSDEKIIRYKNLPSSPERELQLLDAEIKEWSFGKDKNIRRLLSTLHHILWANSGWQEIPITTLIDHSHVKKAYQKARLCLHPDKVQQRGSTFTQKYVAEKTFAILQEAWETFTCQDV